MSALESFPLSVYVSVNSVDPILPIYYPQGGNQHKKWEVSLILLYG